MPPTSGGSSRSRGAAPDAPGTIAAETEASRALSKDLKKRGFSFVGPTTVYAFMQAMGLVNDHIAHCICRAAMRSRADEAQAAIAQGGYTVEPSPPNRPIPLETKELPRLVSKNRFH